MLSLFSALNPASLVSTLAFQTGGTNVLNAFNQFLTTSVQGITSTGVIAGMTKVGYTVLVTGFLWDLYQSAVSGGDVRGLARSMAKYTATGLVVQAWPQVFLAVNHSFVNAGSWMTTTGGIGNVFDSWLSALKDQFLTQGFTHTLNLITSAVTGLLDAIIIIVAYMVYPFVSVLFGFAYILMGSILYVTGPIIVALLPWSATHRLAKSYIENLFIWNTWPLLYGILGMLITAIHIGDANAVLGADSFLGSFTGLDGSILLGLVSLIYSVSIAAIPFMARAIVHGEAGAVVGQMLSAATSALSVGVGAAAGVGAGLAGAGEGGGGGAQTAGNAASQAGKQAGAGTSAGGNQPAAPQPAPTAASTQAPAATGSGQNQPHGQTASAPASSQTSSGTAGNAGNTAQSDAAAGGSAEGVSSSTSSTGAGSSASGSGAKPAAAPAAANSSASQAGMPLSPAEQAAQINNAAAAESQAVLSGISGSSVEKLAPSTGPATDADAGSSKGDVASAPAGTGAQNSQSADSPATMSTADKQAPNSTQGSNAGSSKSQAKPQSSGSGRLGGGASYRAPNPNVSLGSWAAFHAASVATQGAVAGGQAVAAGAQAAFQNPGGVRDKAASAMGTAAGNVVNDLKAAGGAAGTAAKAVAHPLRTVNAGARQVAGAAVSAAKNMKQDIGAAREGFTEAKQSFKDAYKEATAPEAESEKATS